MPPQNRTSTDLNLSVLSRYLPRISHIITSASYAVLYTFSPTTSSWQKSGIEGSLFICALTPTTPNAKEAKLIILNRLGVDNFTFDLADPADIDYDGGEYIMLRPRGEGLGYGLWVYAALGTSTAGDRAKIAEAVKACAGEHAASVAAVGQVPGRRISLAELFRDGQQQSHQPPEVEAGGGSAGAGREVLMRLFEKASGSYRGAP